MKYILILFFILFCTEGYCNKVFYDLNTKQEIIDVSGQKTVAQIREEFNLGSVIEVTLKKDEGYRIKNNSIEVYSVKEEIENGRIAKENSRKNKENSIKTKLNLTDQDFKNLKEALQ